MLLRLLQSAVCVALCFTIIQFMYPNPLQWQSTSLMLINETTLNQLCPSLTSGLWIARLSSPLWCRLLRPDIRSTSAFCTGSAYISILTGSISLLSLTNDDDKELKCMQFREITSYENWLLSCLVHLLEVFLYKCFILFFIFFVLWLTI